MKYQGGAFHPRPFGVKNPGTNSVNALFILFYLLYILMIVLRETISLGGEYYNEVCQWCRTNHKDNITRMTH